MRPIFRDLSHPDLLKNVCMEKHKTRMKVFIMSFGHVFPKQHLYRLKHFHLVFMMLFVPLMMLHEGFGDGPRNFLNHGQVTWTTPELAPPLLTTTPHQWEDVSALDRFNVHRCPTRRVFSGTGLEPVTKQATVRYLYHSATAATTVSEKLEPKMAQFNIVGIGPTDFP
ncbi:uncharacterized protein TNCV_4440411 [Trichonephila clavipes]|nr:uncharacterized protein TNCV_4440411 [Trichonephila clavipes]